MPQAIPVSAQAKTKPISVTDTASTSTALPSIGDSIRIVNEGPNTAFVSIGTGTQTATLPNATPTVTSTPVLAGSDVIFTIPNTQPTMGADGTPTTPTPLNISAICRSSGVATLDVQVGYGV
jgi:hypothetical protein